MNIKIYQEWNFAGILEQIKDDIKNLDFDKYIIVQPQEHYYQNDVNYNIINELLKEKNSSLIIYIGSEYDKSISDRFNRIKFIYWDSIDFFSKYIKFTTYINSTRDESFRFYNYLKDFPPIKHFTSLINIKNYRFWRIHIINELYKNNLVEYGNFSFSFPKSDLDIYNKEQPHVYFEYSGSIKEVIPIITDSWKPQNKGFYRKQIDNQNAIDNMFCSDSVSSEIIDFEYLICAFDIVLESIYDYFFVTEKTLRSIDSKKPFLVFSCKDYHKNLKERYGFRLFENLIDYSFDQEENTTLRWKKLINELVKLKTIYTPIQIKQLTMHNVCYNYEKLIEIRNKNMVLVPKEFIQYNNDFFYKYKCFVYKDLI